MTATSEHKNDGSRPPECETNGSLRKHCIMLHDVNSEKSPEKDQVVTEMDTDNSEYEGSGFCTRYVERVEEAVGAFLKRNKRLITYGFRILLLMAYMGYFSYCMYYKFGDEGSYILLGITIIMWLIILNKLTPMLNIQCTLPTTLQTYNTSQRAKRIRHIIRYVLYLVATIGLCCYLYFDILASNPRNAQSLGGIIVIILMCFIVSVKPSKVNWHPVFWGFVGQVLFATLTLRTDAGYNAFKWLGDLIQTFISYSDAGSAFVIGDDFAIMGLAFWASGALIFFNCIIFSLNHLGVIEFLVVKLGTFLGFCMETGPVESVVAAANIFMGISEAPLLIRPFIPNVTKSELHAIMTCGFASISGGIMTMFIKYGAPPGHLLTAAIISAPAALALSKLTYPETEIVDLSKQTNIKMRDTSDKSQNLLSVCSDGAVLALKMMAPISANMLAFFSLLAMTDAILDWFGQRAGYEGLSFDLICSYLLWPLAYVMGTEPADCGRLGALIGVKLFATPMVAYKNLGEIIENRKVLEHYLSVTNGTFHWEGFDVILDAANTTLKNGVMSPRSEVISTYALCGFSAFTAIGISIGTLTPICPSRKSDILDVVFRAFYVGNMASFATGAVAGIMFTDVVDAGTAQAAAVQNLTSLII
ncbi:solute carrier family 28 member 3 isoform X1 [Aplysia californica]|uniref:Solute carrier family 28 member 3 isoform X1 n=1 Tax=Aplysia californica TaxID=6500 RepID=A0ABM0JIA9_APLCA|nr:solute carrier family 28 member 3 isoform X1 [Aplysia californica]